jgi:hypothetical protein
MVTVPSVEPMLTQSQIVHVLNITSLTLTKAKKFVKFVMLDVPLVTEFSITVLNVCQVLEDLLLHTVNAQMDT